MKIYDAPNVVKIVKVSAGVSHNGALDSMGNLFMWGDCTDFCNLNVEGKDLV
jgi:hypothetical protein